MSTRKYVRLCDWCGDEIIGIKDHTQNDVCSEENCPHDHGGYIRCNDVDNCQKRACKFGGDIRHLRNIEARRFILK